jgi:hypothetical protein
MGSTRVIFTFSSWFLGGKDIRRQAAAPHCVILQWLLREPQNYTHRRLALAARSRRQPVAPDGAAFRQDGSRQLDSAFARLRTAWAIFCTGSDRRLS